MSGASFAHMPPTHHWPGDDAGLSDNAGTDADMSHVVLADEERLAAAAAPPAATAAAALQQLEEGEEEEEEEAEASTSYSLDSLEQAKLLLSGGVAGAFSKSCTAPLARLTILYQINGMHAAHGGGGLPPGRLGVGAALRHVVRSEGLRALWKGNGVTIVHRLPYSATNFWVYEHVNEQWKRAFPSQGPLAAGDVARRLVAGGTAGMSACALAYPLDLVRTRLAAQTTQRHYTGIGQAMRMIVAEEGARGLYRGLGATLVQVVPSLAINYAAYETMRSGWLSTTDRATPTIGMSLACGSAAGLVSSTATFPLDLIRRRLQLQGQGGGGRPATFASTFRSVAQREGLRGLYAGILPEYYKVLPGVAIAFMTYEFMKKSLGVTTNSSQR
ncbi:Mitochondrial substrate carrier family B [Micractinium conductrix]|uniref:Mitochondrial substrate carrier family B n=1 Tax=Micractinium conductrix TaxID=554055 RepID=A0A2P6VLT0_9CHLO|nr:Mitochondrial substrate carrier family B [Micractinium conductrix]|eukprot:PSC75043.1 Mitochondrial substrate carrier family B [Micractinium conductrix]